MAKRKSAKKRATKKRMRSASEDTKQRQKFAKGGRIEAYTFGEAQRSKEWP